MVEKRTLSDDIIDSIVGKHAVKCDTLVNAIEEENNTGAESTSGIPDEVKEICESYNDCLDYLIMTSDITNLERVTLYEDLIGIGFDNKQKKETKIDPKLASTVDFNIILADNKPTNHIVRLNIDKKIMSFICNGYDIKHKLAYIFSLIPTLEVISYDKNRIFRNTLEKEINSLGIIGNKYIEEKHSDSSMENTNNSNNDKPILDNENPFNDIEAESLMNELLTQLGHDLYKNKEIKEYVDIKEVKNSAKSTKTETQAKSPINYAKNSYVNENGVAIQYNEVTETVDWSDSFKNTDTNEDILYNLEYFVKKFTEGLIKRMGGLDKFKEIVVNNDVLIVNNIVYRPFSDNANNLDKLPAGVATAFSQGYYAPFFDWSYLLQCNNLRKLIIDTVEFVEDYIVPANNIAHLNSSWFFKYLRRLTYLKIGDYEFDTEKEQYEPESVKEEKRKNIERESGFFNKAKNYYQKSHFDYGRLAPTRLTDKIDNHFCGTFKDYVKNRGKKGLFRYAGGCVIRGILAGAATLLNAGTHFIGDTAGFLSQYGPHIEKCEDRTGFTCYVGYKPNKRTLGEDLGFTSGSTVTNNRTNQNFNTDIKTSKSEKSKKKDKKEKEDTPDIEFEDE